MGMYGMDYSFGSLRWDLLLNAWEKQRHEQNRQAALKAFTERGDIIDAEFEVIEPLQLTDKSISPPK